MPDIYPNKEKSVGSSGYLLISRRGKFVNEFRKHTMLPQREHGREREPRVSSCLVMFAFACDAVFLSIRLHYVLADKTVRY